MIKYLQPLLHPNQHNGTATKIIIKAPPPPLHCVRLGPTNHLVRALRELWPDLQVFLYIVFLEIIKNIQKVYLSRLHITEEAYHGREYEGNECKKV